MATKGTGRITADRMKEMCEEPLTEKEILNGLDSINVPASINVILNYTNNTNLEYFYLFAKQPDFTIKVYGLSSTFHTLDFEIKIIHTAPHVKKPIKNKLELNLDYFKDRKDISSIDIIPGAVTMKALYMHRGSCLKIPSNTLVERTSTMTRGRLLQDARKFYFLQQGGNKWTRLHDMIVGGVISLNDVLEIRDSSINPFRRFFQVCWLTSNAQLLDKIERIKRKLENANGDYTKSKEVKQLEIEIVKDMQKTYAAL